jgi:hypothetical protein
MKQLFKKSNHRLYLSKNTVTNLFANPSSIKGGSNTVAALAVSLANGCTESGRPSCTK